MASFERRRKDPPMVKTVHDYDMLAIPAQWNGLRYRDHPGIRMDYLRLAPSSRRSQTEPLILSESGNAKPKANAFMHVMQVVHPFDMAITRPSSVLLHVITWKIATRR
jgi:hypothetical protein